MTKAASLKQKPDWKVLHHQLLTGTLLSAPDAIITVDSEQRIFLFNPAAERIFLVRAGAAIGKPVTRFFPQGLHLEDCKNLQRFGQKARTRPRSQMAFFCVLKCRRANGTEFPAEVSTCRILAGGRKYWTAIVRDVSERISAEELLRESSQRLRLAVDTARLGTYERDLISNEVSLNEACREILGLPDGPPPADIARRSAHPEDRERILAAVARAFDPDLREVCAAEFRILRADGTTRWVAGRGRVVFDDTVRPALPQKFLGVLLDITERKLAEAEALRARLELSRINEELEQRVEERTAKLQELMAEWEHMSYSMIHDMRAPLRAIQSFGAILEQIPQIRSDEEAYRLLTKMRTASMRMDQLLMGALNYNEAVRKPWPLDQTNVLQVLRDVLAAHPEFHPPHAEVSLEGSFPSVLANEAGLFQCCAEMLRNGVKFVEAGQLPRVRVWAERVQNLKRDNSLEVEAGPEKSVAGNLPQPRAAWVRLCFEDNGIGIPKNAHARIFDMFQRLHGAEYPGTGIGLALVRKVIEHMGGHIGVQSEQGLGSRFWFELPEPRLTRPFPAR